MEFHYHGKKAVNTRLNGLPMALRLLSNDLKMNWEERHKRKENESMNIVELSRRPDLLEEAVQFFWGQWGSETNREFYKDAMVHSMNPEADLPKFYVLLKENKIVGSYALLRNDLISRQDLVPWAGCLYVVPEERGQGLGGLLLDDACNEAKRLGYSTVYLCTSLVGYYEKYGWSHYGTGYLVSGEPVRIYSKVTG